MSPLSFARLLEPNSLEHADLGPIGQECRGRRPVQAVGELLSVQAGGVPFQARLEGRPRAPARVLDLIFQGASAPAARVTPVVLRDEFLLATGRDLARVAPRGDTDLVLSPVEPPAVRHLAYGRVALAGNSDAVTHRDGDVVLAVEDPGCHGDGGAGHQLLDENDGAAPAVACAPP